jgi:putative exporter of polyketide antibiotics
MNETIVYQVRSIDIYNNQTVVHAYETEAEAQAAIATMRKRTGKRYMYVPVPNQPDQYWGINFPEPVQPPPMMKKKK